MNLINPSAEGHEITTELVNLGQEMNHDNAPIATILCLVGIIILGLLGDSIILAVAPSPISVENPAWWGLIGLGSVHHLGVSATSHYLSTFHLGSWQQIADWAQQNAGYWRWVVIARWWWIIAVLIAICITLRWVWRTPNQPDKHRRGTRLRHDIRAYRKLIAELRHERDQP